MAISHISLKDQDRVVEFLRDAERTGLVAEAERKVEAEDDAKRVTIAAELAALPAEREKGLRSVNEALQTTKDRALEAQARAAMAVSQHDAAWVDWYAGHSRFDLRAGALRKQLAELLPADNFTGFLALGRLEAALKAKINYIDVMPNAAGAWGGSGPRCVSNQNEILPILARIKKMREEIDAMATTATPAAQMRARVGELVSEARKLSSAVLGQFKTAAMAGEEPAPSVPAVAETRKRTAA